MFPAHPLHRFLPGWLQRAVALACVSLVGLLSVAKVSPEIHLGLHGESSAAHGPVGHTHDSGDHEEGSGGALQTDHTCAVTLFNQGAEAGFPPAMVSGALSLLCVAVIGMADQVARAARAAQLPPGRGPPVS